MQGTHIAFEFLPGLEHLLSRECSHAFGGHQGAGKSALFPGAIGHQVGAAQVHKLNAVLQQTQLLVVA